MFRKLIQFIQKHKIISGLFLALIILLSLKNCSKSSNTHPLSAFVQKGTIIESVYGIGTVTANKSFQLKSGITSTLEKIFVKEGDRVKKDDKLVSLDNDVIFTAPFEGTVTYLPLKVGENVFSQTILLNLVDLWDRYIVVSLEQRAAIRVVPGQKARLSFENMREQSFEGVVSSVYSNDNNFLVRIDVAELPSQVLPGMTTDVAINIAEYHDALLVPVAALDADKVYVKHALGQTETVEVKTGVVDGAMAQILSGHLKEKDELIIQKKVKR